MSLFYYKRGKHWYVKGKVWYGKHFISIRQSTRSDSKRTAKTIGRQIEDQALALLQGDVTQTISWSEATLKFIKLKRRNETDLFIAEKLTRFFRNQPIGQITKDDWQRYIIKNGSNWSNTYYNRVRSTFSSILADSNIIVSAKQIPNTLYIPKRKVKGERLIYLSHEQREVLFKSYSPHLEAWAIAHAYHGFRKGESRQLKYSDINLDQDIIHIRKETTKDKEERFIPLHPRLKDKLLVQSKLSEFVFTNIHNKPYCRQGPKKAHQTAIKKANIELARQGKPLIPHFTIHDWRHHWASWFMMSGGDVESLRQLGGWADLKMVQKYATVSNEQKKIGINKLK